MWSQPTPCLWLLFPVGRQPCTPQPCTPQPCHSPLVSSSRAQHPLTSLNTHRGGVCDLSPYRCYQNAKLLAPALRVSAERKLPCRERERESLGVGWREMLDFPGSFPRLPEAAAPNCNAVTLPTLRLLPGVGLLGRMGVLCWFRAFLLLWYSTYTHTLTHTPGRSLTKLVSQ